MNHRGHGGRGGEQLAGGEEGLAEVAADDVFWVADGGEVDAGIPVEEYIDVRRYMLQLRGSQNNRRFVSGLRRFGMTSDGGWVRNGSEKKRFEQLGDAGRIHGRYFRRLIVDGRLGFGYVCN